MMLVSYSYFGKISLNRTYFICMYIIGWKGAAPTGTQKWVGSTTEELPSKRSKQGKYYYILIYSLNNNNTFFCSDATDTDDCFKQERQVTQH